MAGKKDEGGLWWLGGEENAPETPSPGYEPTPKPRTPTPQPDSAFLTESPVVDASPYGSVAGQSPTPPPPPNSNPPQPQPFDSLRTNAPRGAFPSNWNANDAWDGSSATPASSENPYLPAGSSSSPRRQPTANKNSPPAGKPPRASRTSGGSGKGRRFPTLLLAGIIAVLAAVLITWQVSGSGTGIGKVNNPFFNVGPTATRIGNAKSAKITFARATQSITVTSPTLTAITDGSGAIKATAQSTNGTGSSATIKSTLQIASPVDFNLTVTNNSDGDARSAGITISSSDGKVTCQVQGNLPVPAHSNIKQECISPLKSFPAATWNDSTSNPPLIYTGSSPAGGNTAYYYVPDCNDPSAAQAALRTTLLGQLGTPAGSVVFFGPTINIDTGSLACTPKAGTQQATSFTYTQTITGSVSQSIFSIADAQNYQTDQLKKQIPNKYTLIDAKACPDGPKAGTDATATKVTITCPTTGTVGWNWTPDALQQLGASLAGASVSTATLQLGQTPGITPGSVKIDLTDGSVLPVDGASITWVVG